MTQETKVVLRVDPSRTENSFNKPEHWDIRLYKMNGKTAILEVQIGCEAPVGEWRCQIVSFGQVLYEYKSIYILFNPFSSGKLKYCQTLYYDIIFCEFCRRVSKIYFDVTPPTN